MSQQKLLDYQVDQDMELFVLIKAAEVRIAKNGKKFIAFVFADVSGEIAGKYWDASPEDILQFQAGKVVFLKGKREVYQQSPQVKILGLRLATVDEPSDPNLYVQGAPVSLAELQQSFAGIIAEITQPDLKKLVLYLLKKHEQAFFEYPAAKTNHHAYARGLAYHTLSIVRLAQSVSQQYPQINRSLLYAGALLHDLGKIIELSGPVATSYTLEGNLIGHIVLVDEELVLACEQLGIDKQAEEVLLLRHIILAHHGLLEYGSPVTPHILEAEILHHLDDLDATIQMINTALEKTTPGEFSERVFGLDRRNFYRSKFD